MLAGDDAKPTDNENPNELRGAIFQNRYKEKDNQPDFSGMVTVKGEEYRIAGWLRTSKAGQQYTSIALTPQAEIDARKEARRQEEQSKLANDPDLNDDIPF